MWEIKKSQKETKLCQYQLDYLAVVKDSNRKKGESLLSSTPVVVLSSILGRIPTIDEYKVAVKDIKLTKFSPPLKKMTSKKGHLLSY